MAKRGRAARAAAEAEPVSKLRRNMLKFPPRTRLAALLLSSSRRFSPLAAPSVATLDQCPTCRRSRRTSFRPSDLLLLQRSGLFDTAWFIGRNPDLAAAGLDPLLHFHRFGWREGRWPNAYFDTDWYLRYNRDVAAAGIDPLLHYAAIRRGGGPQADRAFRARVVPGAVWRRRRTSCASRISCAADCWARSARCRSSIPALSRPSRRTWPRRGWTRSSTTWS